MSKKISKPSLIVTLIITYLLYKGTEKVCDHFEVFKSSESSAFLAAKEIIDLANTTKFTMDGPTLLKYNKEKCQSYNNKITWSIVKMGYVSTEKLGFWNPHPNQIPVMHFASEDAWFYYLTHGVIPRHFIKTFLSYEQDRLYDKEDHISNWQSNLLYTSWKNIVIEEGKSFSPELRSKFCTKILHEVRKPTPEELEQYKEIEPELFFQPQH